MAEAPWMEGDVWKRRKSKLGSVDGSGKGENCCKIFVALKMVRVVVEFGEKNSEWGMNECFGRQCYCGMSFGWSAWRDYG